MRHLTRLLKSIRVLGLRNGVIVFWWYAYHRMHSRTRWATREIRLRTLRKPIWIRPGVSDWIVMERIFLDREYDPVSAPHDAAMNALCARITASGGTPLIMDCGANAGLSAVWFAERFPTAVVVAIEPEQGNFDVLSRNAENYPTIRPLRAAISHRAGRVTLVNTGDTPWAWTTREVLDGEVATVTPQQIIDSDPSYVPLAMKIDIEGFETTLLAANTEWADDLPLTMFEMHDWMTPWSGSGAAFMTTLSRITRDYLIRGENVFAYAHTLAAEPNAPASQASGLRRAVRAC